VADKLSEISVRVGRGPDADAADLNDLVTQLRAELLHLDVAAVDIAREGEAPPDSKGLEVLAVGKLLVHLAAAPGAIAEMVKALRSWLSRDERRSVTLEINGNRLELSDVTSADQGRLIEHWIANSAGQ
jgi:hypothetical protein